MRRILSAMLGVSLLLGCEDGESRVPDSTGHGHAHGATNEPPVQREGPPGARWEVYDSMKAAMNLAFHPSDGGGRAWLEEDPSPAVPAGGAGRWTIVYEAGPEGIAIGGLLCLQVSPFWGWSTPQTTQANTAGFTVVTTAAEGVELSARTLDQQLLGIEIAGRALARGEQVRIEYGGGPAMARADRFAESESRFWIAVDGDGDGVRKVLVDSPSIPVEARAPKELWLTLPSVAHPGERHRLTVAALDAGGNAGYPLEGSVQLQSTAGLKLPATVEFRAEHGGRRTIEIEVVEAGIYQVLAEGPEGLRGYSNPMLVRAGAPRIHWADFQIHTGLSDGTGTIQDVLSYARDVAALDIAAITDHDHWGMLFLDRYPHLWEQSLEQVQSFQEPGRFLALAGYEWTNWIHGHRHVIYFDPAQAALFSSLDERYDTPPELWSALRGKSAMTIAHHSAGAPVPVNWDYPPDPQLEPVTEVVSVHGSSEAPDTLRIVRGALKGNFVRDQIDRGYRLGFIGSTDGHDGHPGLGHLASPCGGLAAILCDELTADAVQAALMERRVYATSGPRIVLRVQCDDAPMGAVLPADSSERKLVVRGVGTAPIDRIVVIRSGAVVAEKPVGQSMAFFEHRLEDLQDGEYVYVRLEQVDRHFACSSPIYFEARP